MTMETKNTTTNKMYLLKIASSTKATSYKYFSTKEEAEKVMNRLFNTILENFGITKGNKKWYVNVKSKHNPYNIQKGDYFFTIKCRGYKIIGMIDEIDETQVVSIF